MDSDRADQIKVEFEYTATEVGEAVRAVTRPEIFRRLFPALLIWVPLLVLFISLVDYFTVPAPVAVAAPQRASSWWPDIFLPLIPWAAMLVTVPVVLRFIGRGAVKRHPLFGRIWTLEFDNDQVRFSRQFLRTEASWEAFIDFQKTRSLYMLYITKNQAIAIPKRVLNSDATERFCELTTSQIHRRTSAFPILPTQSK
jgi:hypothetical protein